MPSLKISNRAARRLWLSAQGLAASPRGRPDVMAIIRQLGFVQLDTIQVVARAHHHILWSRNQHYREPMLDALLTDHRAVFEHFTHDASVLPMEFLPVWRRQFHRMRARVQGLAWYANMLDAKGRAAILARIAAEGPLSTQAFDTMVEGPREMWARPPHKLALDYLWLSGELATSHRRNFTKFYDLAERVFPADLRDQRPADKVQVDWLCGAALDRIGFGTLGEIQKFWNACDRDEVKAWAGRAAADLVPVDLQAADGNWSTALAAPDIEARLACAEAATSRLRILNPFDPVIRDRNRLQRLFGFDYRVEMFVPAAKRRWGYYVFPLLEADRFVGRIEIRADRAQGRLEVLNAWAEPGIRWTRARAAKLEAELDRLARFVGVAQIAWTCAAPETC